MMKFFFKILIALSLVVLTLMFLGQHWQYIADYSISYSHQKRTYLYLDYGLIRDDVQIMKDYYPSRDNKTEQNRTTAYTKCEHADENRITEFYKGFTKKARDIEIPVKTFPVDVCGNRNRPDPYAVIIIASLPEHTVMRQTIRETWASFKHAGNISVEGDMKNKTIGLVFILGNLNSYGSSVDTASHESSLYRDILQVDMNESSNNLVYKVLAGLGWVANNCKGSKYLLKVDEDVYVHLPRLVDILQQHEDKDAIIGYKHSHSHPSVIPKRFGKYALTFQQYRFCRLLTYVEGNSYVISAGLIPKIINMSHYIPPNKIEDHYLTGILRSAVDAPIINDGSFCGASNSKLPSLQQFYKNGKTTKTRCTVLDMKKLWSLYKQQ